MAYENVDRTIQDERRKLLEAVATAGTAGRQAYEQARQATAQQDAASSARALQAAALNGVDPAALGAPGSVRAAAEHALATRRANLEQAQATFGADLARRQAATENYLTQVSGAVPVMQARADEEYKTKFGDLQRDIATRQSDLDRALALAQQRYEQAQKDAEEDRTFKREQREWARETQAAKVAKAKEPKPLTRAQLLGAGQTLSDAYADMLGMKPGSKGTFAADESARALAAYKGIDPVEVNTLLGPRKPTGPEAVQLPSALSRDWIKSNTGYSDKRTDEILRAPEVALADQFIGTLAGTKFTAGRIDDASASDFAGLTARQAFEQWLDNQPGIRSMKDSLKAYYGPWLDANLGR